MTLAGGFNMFPILKMQTILNQWLNTYQPFLLICHRTNSINIDRQSMFPTLKLVGDFERLGVDQAKNTAQFDIIKRKQAEEFHVDYARGCMYF